jgi:SulP family sulfate permease
MQYETNSLTVFYISSGAQTRVSGIVKGVLVIGVALTIGLIAASVAGVALSILLFLREQVGGRCAA